MARKVGMICLFTTTKECHKQYLAVIKSVQHTLVSVVGDNRTYVVTIDFEIKKNADLLRTFKVFVSNQKKEAV